MKIELKLLKLLIKINNDILINYFNIMKIENLLLKNIKNFFYNLYLLLNVNIYIYSKNL